MDTAKIEQDLADLEMIAKDFLGMIRQEGNVQIPTDMDNPENLALWKKRGKKISDALKSMGDVVKAFS